jgi:hypothetical protein
MLRRVYFDSCCFIELAKGKFGKTLLDGGKHIWYLETLLRASKAGKIQVCTSLLTVAECVGAGGDISAEVRQLFMGLLTSGKGGVLLLQSDLWVIERARDLRWKDGLNFKCPDSVHIASAMENECAELLTMDGMNGSAKSILKAAPALLKLGLRVCTPADTVSITDEMRQQSIPYGEEVGDGQGK